MFLWTQEEQKIMFELAKREQNEVSKHSFSQNAIWNIINNFIYVPS